MLFLNRPSPERIVQFLAVQAKLDFSYPEVGCTRGPVPAGYVSDHSRIALGHGEKIYQAARQALGGWQQFKLGWLSPYPDTTPLTVGQNISVLARLFPVWWLNACRIVYQVDEQGEVQRHGFAYGTLPDHAEAGEERFVVEWDRRDDQVWLDILAYSRPRHILTKLGYPMVRRMQKRFGREATAHFKRVTLEMAK